MRSVDHRLSYYLKMQIIWLLLIACNDRKINEMIFFLISISFSVIAIAIEYLKFFKYFFKFFWKKNFFFLNFFLQIIFYSDNFFPALSPWKIIHICLFVVNLQFAKFYSRKLFAYFYLQQFLHICFAKRIMVI